MSAAAQTPAPEELETLQDLRTLARAVTLDATVEVLATKGKDWSFDLGSGCLLVPRAALEELSPEALRGRLCLEAAQLAVTRLAQLVPADTLRLPGLRAALQSLEACRSARWLQTRFPGVTPWLQGSFAALLPPPEELSRAPSFLQWCLGALEHWRSGALPEGLGLPARVALESTSDARARFLAEQPPTDLLVPPEVSAAYAQSALPAVFSAFDRLGPEEPFEHAVRLRALASWRIFWLELYPVVRELAESDAFRGCDCARCSGELCSKLPDGCSLRPSPRTRRRRRSAQRPPGFLRSGSCSRPALGEGDEEPSETFLPGRGLPSDEALRARVRRELESPPGDLYEEALREVGALVDRLATELERVLRPQSYPRWVRGFSSGSAIDLGAALRFQADPASYTRLWMRKTLPKKRDWHFYVLLDLSGSMSGERIRHAFRGVVLTVEVLARLGVPFAVHGFQDVLIHFKDFGEPLDASTRKRLGAMPLEVEGQRPDGHNQPGDNFDGPVLRAAAAELSEAPGSPKVLLVLSDGEPSGPGDGSSELTRAVAHTLQQAEVLLVGVGIGPGTEHVQQYYPEAIANVPLDTFAATLGQCLERHLLA